MSADRDQPAPFRLVVMPGEGVGPEVTAEGLRIFTAAARVFGVRAKIETFDVGEETLARTGRPWPIEAEAACDAARASGHGAILFGSVVDEPIGILRKQYDLFANLRPIRTSERLIGMSPLRPERASGVDMLIVRELVGDVYYGEAREGVDADGAWATQEMRYHERDVRRIVRVGLHHASRRRNKLVVVHKGNVIKGIFGMWLRILAEEARAYPGVETRDILVDNMAMQCVLRPREFDVVLCSNMFGDILSDIGAGLVGSLGLLPSASRDESGFALYEPVGGTAPDIAGRDIANPIASILSVALLWRYSLDNDAAARAIEKATEDVLASHRTADIMEPGTERVSTRRMGELIERRLIETTPRDRT